MKTKTLDLQFPLAGVSRRTSFHGMPRQRAPYTTPWAVNCTVHDPNTLGLRGGSRPGLSAYTGDPIGEDVFGIYGIPPVDESQKFGVLTSSGVIGQLDEDGVYTVMTPLMLFEDGQTMLFEDGTEMLFGTGDLGTPDLVLNDPGDGWEIIIALRENLIYLANLKTGVIETLEATAGAVPEYCTVGCFYRDRMILGAEDSEDATRNAIYCSRQGVKTDWDYGADAEDAGRAMIFQLSGAGALGPAITCLIPHEDKTLLVASASSLWLVQGDPVTGTLTCLSHEVGIVDKRAWCKAGDTVYFLADTGLYQVSVTGGELTCLSDERLPDEFRDIDPVHTTVFMGYHHPHRALHIFLNPADGIDWWIYNLETKSFWPASFQELELPLAVCQFEGQMLMAFEGGAIATMGGTTDGALGADPIESHLLIGPLRLSSESMEGILNEVHGSLAAGSADVNWRIIAGNSADEAVADAITAMEAYRDGGQLTHHPKASGTFTAGRSQAQYPRVLGAWFVLWLQADDAWAFESVVLRGFEAGRYR